MHRHFTSPLSLALLLVGCATDSPESTDETTDADSTGPASSSGHDGASTETGSGTDTQADSHADSGPASTSGDTDHETFSPEGSGGEGPSDSGSTGADEPPALDCAPSTVHLSGEIEGVPVDVTGPPAGVMTTAIGVMLDLGGGGAVHMHAQGFQGIAPTEPVSGYGYLLLPPQEDDPSEWYCFDDSSQYVGDGDSVYAASLEGLRSLGACPGTPVAGTVSVCFPGGSCGEPSFVSEAEGAEFESPMGEGVLVSGLNGSPEVDVFTDFGYPDGGVLYLHAEDVGPETEPTVSTVDFAYFTVPPDAPDAGAVYCAEVGSTLLYVNEEGYPYPLSAELHNLSRLGSCDGSSGPDGAVDLCMNLNQ